MFPACSLNVPCMFTEHSLNVHRPATGGRGALFGYGPNELRSPEDERDHVRTAVRGGRRVSLREPDRPEDGLRRHRQSAYGHQTTHDVPPR